jgi:lipoprotein-anchoring transpeptidase ErfK/SrfK
VKVHAAADGPVTRTLANPQPSGAPLVFLVRKQAGAWVEVELPVRPNGSTGWVRAADVTIAGVAYRLDVLRSEHQLKVYKFGSLERTLPIGVGKGETPTPGGTFYLKELLRPPNPRGAYGPYAYGLSGFSNTLTSFNGGNGVIGLHGTNEPQLVGKDVSHGCIRLRNADITSLVHELPLGTPVRILA